MATRQAADDKFIQRLSKRLAPLETRRKALMPVVVGLWVVLPLVLAAVTVRLVDSGAFVAALVGAGLGALAAWGLGRVLKRRWVQDYKAAAIARMVEQLGHPLAYHPQGKLAKDSFERSGLFPATKNAFYSGDDLVLGTVNGLDVGFCEVRVTQEGSQFKETDAGRQVNGVFLEATIPVLARCTVLLIPKGMDAAWCKKSKAISDGMAEVPPPCEVGDPELTVRFAVRAIHEPSAQRLLNPERAARVKAIADRAEGRVMVAFDRDKLFMFLPIGRFEAAFEPTLMKPIDETGALETHLEMLRLMTDLVATLAIAPPAEAQA